MITKLTAIVTGIVMGALALTSPAMADGPARPAVPAVDVLPAWLPGTVPGTAYPVYWGTVDAPDCWAFVADTTLIACRGGMRETS